jgi:hypothetical protein
MELGANAEIVDSNGWTAQDIAKACGHESIAIFIRLRQKKITATELKSGTSSTSVVQVNKIILISLNPI